MAAELESAKADLEAKKLEKEVVVATIAAEKTDVQEQKEYYLSLKEAAETEVATLTSIDAEIASAVENVRRNSCCIN